MPFPESSLKKWLVDEANSRSREYLTTARVVHDLMTAAAARGYALQIYTPTVDRDGFDLILGDRDYLVPLQLKSVIEGGKAGFWKIHRQLLRPARHDVELFGFEPSPNGEGQGGGVLLITIHPGEAGLSLLYRYTDISVLSVLWMGLFKLPNGSVRCLEQLRKDLGAHPTGMVRLPRSAFLTAKGPEELLALIGLHSRATRGEWPRYLRLILQQQYLKPTSALPAPVDVLRRGLIEGLSQLVEERTAT